LDVLKRLGLTLATLVLLSLTLSGCSLGYLIMSANSQADILRRRVPVEEALKDTSLSAEQKRKIQLAVDAHQFAIDHLNLKKTKAYTTYTQLDRPYVTYVVSAAPKNELKHYLWKYPLVGEMPYRGYFNKAGAEEEQKEMHDQGYDTYMRGVSAYSTLGWFNDPILSTMLNMPDSDLVNTIIHETVHATIFIKSEADFNERLAVFIGNKGTELFYSHLEGPDSKTLETIKQENQDEKVFSAFISRELNDLEKWYSERLNSKIDESERRLRIEKIRTDFAKEVRPLISKDMFRGFETAEFNNARLLTYRLYLQDLSDFEALFAQLGGDFPKLVQFCKDLEKQKDPQGYLRTSVAKH
jgi:predicted aminopeptidase